MGKVSASKQRHGSRPLALVTGASSGIGAAFAVRLARDGYNLILVARNRARLEQQARQLAADHGGDAEVLAADLTEAVELRVVEQVAEGAQLDLLVNNAGFGTAGAFAELDTVKEEEEIRLNVLALVRLSRAALPGMLARNRGALINVSSMAALQPAPYNATYGATKAFVNSFTEALSEEVRGTAVRVQALCPGFTRTEFQDRAGIDVSQIPSFAWMTPEAVVDASLAALRRGEVVCIPGLGNRALATVTAAVPRRVARWVLGSATRRLFA